MIDAEEIAVFLVDRYAEKQQLAKAAAKAAGDRYGNPYPEWHGAGGAVTACGVVAAGCQGDLDPPIADHIAAHDPAAVLVDLAVKRAIVTAYIQAKADFDAAAPHARDVSAFDGGILTGHMVGLREAVTMLAAEFAGHPKCKPEWSAA